ncbi:hypothetical protein [Escherichia coli]|nr:hypothetical protein [Escherichia coli]
MADWFIATEGVKVVKDSASVNATMFDRYGAADDFLDSQEIKHVY